MNEEHLGGWDPVKRIGVVVDEESVRAIVKGDVYMSWELGDEGSQRMAIAQLYKNGVGNQEELAEAFGLHLNTVENYISHYAREGFEGLIAQRRGPKGGWKLTPGMRSRILRLVLCEGICGVDGIERELRERWGQEVSSSSVRAVLLENGLMEEPRVEDPVDQGELFEMEEDAQLGLFAGLDECGEEESLWPSELTGWLARTGGPEDSAGVENDEFDAEGVAWSASETVEGQLQFSGGRRGVQAVGVSDPAELRGLARKDTGVDRGGEKGGIASGVGRGRVERTDRVV
jgi:transposase